MGDRASAGARPQLRKRVPEPVCERFDAVHRSSRSWSRKRIMRTFDLIAVLVVLAAVFSYVNLRLLRLPPTIGLMALSLALSVGLVVTGIAFPAVGRQARVVVEQFEFGDALLHGMLGFLLFAGSLQVDIGDLARHKGPVALLATVGVLLSTAIVGGLTWVASLALHLGLRPIDCFLFGALISPTDPIAVLSLLKQIGAPKSLEVQIAGESLFNDGVGVAVFIGLLEIATGGRGVGIRDLAGLFLREAGGGAALGFSAGVLVYRLMRSVDHYQVEILLSLALVTGGYALAEALGVSGPIAMVVAGLLIGNQGRSFAMSETTTQRLDEFWELVDEILNAVLFVSIGLEVLVLSFDARMTAAGLLAIPAVLFARFMAVGLPVRMMARWDWFPPATVRVLTWGGLRGGISVALALSLPRHTGSDASAREVILTVTYVVVVFSILVQGMTIAKLTRRWLARADRAREAASVRDKSGGIRPESSPSRAP